jgi:hypothetical protein
LSLFGALINGLVLIAGSAWVLVTAFPRLADPVMPHTEGMLALAVLGVAVNGYAAYHLSQGKTLNEKVLNWHLLEDVLGWVAVLIVATVMQFVDWPILDPLLSIGFTLFILINVLRNLWATGRLFFQAVPDPDLLESVRESLMSLKEIDDVHHLHLWSLDGEHHVLTAHVKAVLTQDLAGYAQLKSTPWKPTSWLTPQLKSSWPKKLAGIKPCPAKRTRINKRTSYVHPIHARIVHHHRYCGNSRLLSAIPLAEEIGISMGASAGSVQLGTVCLVAVSSSDRCGAGLCGLWRRLCFGGHTVFVGCGWDSPASVGLCWCGRLFGGDGHYHVRTEMISTGFTFPCWTSGGI